MLWELLPEQEELVRDLTRALKLNPVIARVLVNRGISSISDAQKYLYSDLTQLHSPELLSGIEDAVERIKEAVNRNEKILIYGDYDVDGITSIALLYNFFMKIGKRVDYFIPDRHCMGYGLNHEALRNIVADGYSLIITVDCGISNVEELKYAKELGLDIIITDHHEPLSDLPPASAVINPKIYGEMYPFKFLAGVGVAFKLYQKLLKDFDFSDHFIYSALDIVALGTIADIVPLIGENRIIARYGLKKMKKTDSIGLNALIKSAGINAESIGANDVAFVMAPRINACGRIDDPKLAVRLLTTDDKEEASFLARKLDEINRKRQRIEAEIMKEAERMIETERMEEDPALVLYSEKWHSGVIGIVTSKLKEKYFRPVILISIDNGLGRASARSIAGFPLHKELACCADLLNKYGGHEMAAGFTIPAENIPEFAKQFKELVKRDLGQEIPKPTLKVDSIIDFAEIDYELIKDIQRLAPFGMGNPQPVFATRDISILDASLVGSNQKHLKLKVRKEKRVFHSIGFNLGALYDRIYSPAQSVSAAYNLSLNTYHNERSIQLKIKDLVFKKPFRQGGNDGKMENSDP